MRSTGLSDKDLLDAESPARLIRLSLKVGVPRFENGLLPVLLKSLVPSLTNLSRAYNNRIE